jgi:hypothetical protein
MSYAYSQDEMVANMAKENWVCNVCIGKGWMDVGNSLSKKQASPTDMIAQCNKHAKPPGVMCDNCAEFYNQRMSTRRCPQT